MRGWQCYPRSVRATLFALCSIIALTACGRLGFELVDVPSAGNGGSSGSAGSAGAAGSAGTEPDGSMEGRDGGTSTLDAGSDDASTDGATMTSDGGITDAAAIGDASTADAQTDAAQNPCGNGTLEAPEQCDDSTESAACDSDCTFATCGDGTLNSSAGEGCDDGAPSPACGVSCGPPSCRVGCTCEWYRGVRYMLCAEELLHAAAQVACTDESMRLVRITSAQEQVWLRFRTQQAGFPKFHLGASDLAAEGEWRWDDGAHFWQGVANGSAVGGAFTLWDPGEPNSFVVGENCSEVQTIRGWNDCVCDLPKPVVCKEYRAAPSSCGNGVIEAGEACDDGGMTTDCDADCSPAVCGDGVVNNVRGEVCDDANTADYCDNDCTSFRCPAGCTCFDVNGRGFAVCPGAPTFQQAAIACGRAGMTLARVYDGTVDQQLRSRATLAGIGELWIGGYDIDQANSWVWTDRAPLWNGTATGMAQGYAHFTTGAPSGMANRDCLALLDNGEWQDVDCSTTRAYACERL